MWNLSVRSTSGLGNVNGRRNVCGMWAFLLNVASLSSLVESDDIAGAESIPHGFASSRSVVHTAARRICKRAARTAAEVGQKSKSIPK